jgi:hypothetical protein
MGQAGCPFVAVFHVYEIFGAKSLAFDVRACVRGWPDGACVVRRARGGLGLAGALPYHSADGIRCFLGSGTGYEIDWGFVPLLA